jgi:cyanophycinase
MSLFGPVALLGGGEFLPTMMTLDRLLLEGRPRQVVHLPTAAGTEGEARLRYWENLAAKHFTSFGIRIDTLPVIDRESAESSELAERILGAGIVYLSDGNPEYLVHVLSGSRVWQGILDAWASGAALAGSSAGAMALAERIPGVRIEDPSGLCVVPGVSVIPRFERYNKRFKATLKKADSGVVFLGIDEDTAIHNLGGQWKVYGTGLVHVIAKGRRERIPAGEPVSF